MPETLEDQNRPTPYIDETGTLIVPAACDNSYHWWAGGKTIAAILTELKAPRLVWEKYCQDEYPDALKKENYPLLTEEL